MGMSMIEHHCSVNSFNDFKELQVVCTLTVNYKHYGLLLLTKISEGHIKIRPVYVSVITHKTSFCEHNFVHFLKELAETQIYFVFISFQLCCTICHLEDPRKPACTETEW
jgi:hypothetical protein